LNAILKIYLEALMKYVHDICKMNFLINFSFFDKWKNILILILVNVNCLKGIPYFLLHFSLFIIINY